MVPAAIVRTFFSIALMLCGAGALLATIALPATAEGQFFAPGSDAYLAIEPTTPSPGDTVNVSISVFSVDTNGMDTRWYIDGVEQPDERGARNIAVQLGFLGDSIHVRADVSPPQSAPFSIERTIVASAVDLIIEADTRTPSFYRGRALPVADEPVTATAIPYLGGDTAASAFVYTWQLGDTTLYGGPVIGRTRATFTMPKRATRLSVTVSTSGGVVVGEASTVIRIADPEVLFYEDNELRGLSRRAINGSLSLVGEETSVRAEPYYVGNSIFNENPQLRWSINGRPASGGDNLNAITLRSTGGSGSARVQFSLMSRRSFSQSANGSFMINFE